MAERVKRLRDFVTEHWLALTMVVVLAIAGDLLEEHRRDLPPLVAWQSFAYRTLAHLDPQQSYADHVVVVKIDDLTWKKVGFEGITDRHFLATVIRRAAAAGAAVVALDIDLSVDPAADDHPQRVKANRDLLAAIEDVGRRAPPVPVVVDVGFNGGSELRNVFADSELPHVLAGVGALIGFDNAPYDERTLPLVALQRRASDSQLVPFYSLALRAADSYGRLLHFRTPITQRSPVNRAIVSGEFVYHAFLHEEDFESVSALDVAAGRPRELSRLAHRVVLVGGYRKNTSGELIDRSTTPVGEMVGVFIHANRIEALLGGHMKGTLPWWVPFVVDLVLGFTMVAVWFRARTLRERLWLIPVFAVPIAAAYVLSVNLQYALDFALPLFVLMIDLVLEAYHGIGRKEAHHA